MFNDRKLKLELERIEAQHQEFSKQYEFINKTMIEVSDMINVLLSSYEEKKYDDWYKENIETPEREYRKCLEQMEQS